MHALRAVQQVVERHLEQGSDRLDRPTHGVASGLYRGFVYNRCIHDGQALGTTLFNFGQAILNYCSSLRQHALPAQCLACSAKAIAANLCEGCRKDLPYLPEARCPKCGVPSLFGDVCGGCLTRPPMFDRALVGCAYAFPLDRLIQSFKYAGNLAVAPLLAELMLTAIEGTPLPDVIVPMPLSPERLRERGFNQSLVLAKLLAARTGVALAPEACVRVRHDEAQSALPWAARAANVRNAFVCTEDLAGGSVAVVDDVLTTGATLNEVARSLRERGATEIVGWVAARTLQPHG
ncbi:MAG: ComF family protein [Betaproteobacteria bacterium]|nr:MAG: ComF family protein [Betaproteobacteria bacterium]